jgi:dTDP-4-dehydrorhamnose 3,5-epimerase
VRLEALEIDGAYALVAEPVRDERGWFARYWDADELEAAGLAHTFVQQSAAWNALAGTLRGLHVVIPPASESKIVRCVRGAVHDVILDARPGSRTFGRHVAIRLDAEVPRAAYVPAGCAHGYQTLVDATEVLYDISERYEPAARGGVAHDDPGLGIVWPRPVSAISARDAALPSLADFVAAAELVR